MLIAAGPQACDNFFMHAIALSGHIGSYNTPAGNNTTNGQAEIYRQVPGGDCIKGLRISVLQQISLSNSAVIFHAPSSTCVKRRLALTLP
jgi:hypothetical protein